MEISIIDQETIQCIMTEEEMAGYGLDKKALLENDGRVQDFFRQVMQQAEQETGFQKQKGNVAVYASFLSDETLEIIFSTGYQNNSQQNDTKELYEHIQLQQEMTFETELEVAVFKAKSVMELIAFCKQMQIIPDSCAYKYKKSYFLLADIRRFALPEIGRLFYLADNYMESSCYTTQIAAYLKEHGTCMIRDHAVERLASL